MKLVIAGQQINKILKSILRTAQQIYELKQQIEAATPREKRRLQRKLKELQILQLWQLEQEANNEINPD